MKIFKYDQLFEKIENVSELQDIVNKLKTNRLHLEGKEYLLNNIIIDLLDSIIGKKINSVNHSELELKNAIEKINTYINAK
jgi:hypothetical protein